MELLVVDSNVILKLFVNEEHSDRALAMLGSYAAGNISIMAPSDKVQEKLT
jgi:predicted nucleic acid-binding protein